MAITQSILIADVMHKRLLPRVNGFTYKVYYLCFALSQMQKLSKASAMLALNRPGLFSFYEKDHGSRDGSSLEGWIRDILRKWGITKADGDIVLIALPRLFGYVFNPVSFWFCLDKERQVRAVLCEVNNTFGERHDYLCFHDDHRPIASDDWIEGRKVFHVSPLLKVQGEYRYRFHLSEAQIGVWIDYYDSDGKKLLTSLTGKQAPLTTKALLGCFFRYPLITFKVITLIHYQALKMLMKGIRYVPRPPLPEEELTR